MLGVNGATNSKGRVELYERGYGKDAAGIAKEAIAYGKLTPSARSSSVLTRVLIARDNDFDVVLIDTAGRMQDNEVCCIPEVVPVISPHAFSLIASHACTCQGTHTQRQTVRPSSHPDCSSSP